MNTNLEASKVIGSKECNLPSKHCDWLKMSTNLINLSKIEMLYENYPAFKELRSVHLLDITRYDQRPSGGEF